MRLVHLSDVHLGFRAYDARDRGWNLRERDLASAFRSALQEVGRLEPDLILIAGDVFDRPDPPPTALLTAGRSLAGLRKRLPSAPILIIAGERDTPINPADPGPVAILDTLPGVEAAAGAPRAVRFRKGGLHVLMVPYRSTQAPPFPELRPDPDARWNVLMLRSGLPLQIERLPMDPGDWDYVALGGPHEARQWGPRVWSAGALERPGWDPWSEAMEERGFISFDLDRASADFHPILGRPVVDLAPVRVMPDDIDAGTRRLRELLAGVPGGIAGKLIRIPFRGDVQVPTEGVSQSLLDGVRARAAHLEIRLQGPGAEEGPSDGPAQLRGGASFIVWNPDSASISTASGATVVVKLSEARRVLFASESEARRSELVSALTRAHTTPTISELEDDVDPRIRVDLAPPVPDDPVVRALWTGDADPERLLRRVLVGMREISPGQLAVAATGDRAESEVSHESGVPEAVDGSSGADSANEDAPRARTESDSTELESLKPALRALRGDAMEASGDVDARTLQWAQERQDAETNLEAYRTRARELQERIRALVTDGDAASCPTCRQPLGCEVDRLVSELRGEWESVVQDGRWWRRRREQLDEKPEDLRDLESRALRLHARIEETMERLRGASGALPDAGGPSGMEVGRADDSVSDDAGLPSDPSTERAARSVLRVAGTVLARITEGRLEGIRLDGRGLGVVERDGTVRRTVGAETAALRFAIHLAVWIHARNFGVRVEGLCLWELHEAGSEAYALPALELIAGSNGFDVPVLFVGPPRLAERVPEAIDAVVDLDAVVGVRSGSGPKDGRFGSTPRRTPPRGDRQEV